MTALNAIRGKAPFLSIEGIDGAGKTTQLDLLHQALSERGVSVARVRDPGGTPLGDRLRSLLLERPIPIALSAEALLFFASRAQLVEEQIVPALRRGQAVITDRFTLSTVAYQGHAGGLDPDMLWRVANLATGGLEPDHCFLLDMDPGQARQRRDGPTDHIERKSLAFHEKVRHGFLQEARHRPDAITVLNALDPPGVLHEAIWHKVARLLHAVEEGSP